MTHDGGYIHSRYLSEGELNELYGDNGKTFKTLDEAIAYQTGRKNARIYVLWKGFGQFREPAGYLVSIEGAPPAGVRYTGKVRTSE